jgi:hypothetical protein
MSEPEEDLELNRLVSGELTSEESLAFMKRMLHDKELRQAYDSLRQVDELAREIYLDDQSGTEDDHAPEVDAAVAWAGDRREKEVRKILAAIESKAARQPRSWKFRLTSPRWAVAAAVLVICSLSLMAFATWELQRAALMARNANPLRHMDEDYLQQMADVRNRIGENAVIVWNGNSASFGMVQNGSSASVAVRVTVVRTQGDDVQSWAADGVVLAKHIVEMVTEERTPDWPDSIRISIKPDQGPGVAVSVHARLVKGSASEINVEPVIEPSKPKMVGGILVGDAKYELFIQAEILKPTAAVM